MRTIKQINFFIALLCVVLILHNNKVYANFSDTKTLTEVLILKFPKQTRRTIITNDPIEYKIVNNQWTAPAEGDLVVFDGEESSKWQKMTANDDGWFQGKEFRGAYAYTTIELDEPQVFILESMAHNMVYVNGEPRAGNRYQYKEKFDPWEPKFNFSFIPIKLKKGKNELLFKCNRGRLKINLHKPNSNIFFNINDLTYPDFIIKKEVDAYAAVVIVNATETSITDSYISALYNENLVFTKIPEILPLTIRKVGFKIVGTAPKEEGSVKIELKLLNKNINGFKEICKTEISLNKVNSLKNHRHTFISDIDGSVQYYAVNPAQDCNDDSPKALFLSVHGANVEAFNQAGAYNGKTWGHIVAPTNRRPYGCNWEDWGRHDAMEVLNIATQTLNINPDRIYLTGHSMGGHGTWHIGAIYPDQFAAIGPSAGWISFSSYSVRDKLEHSSPIEKMLMRSSLPSDTYALATNYTQQGVYIIHGADDKNVPAEQAHLMIEHIKDFHKDYDFHEEPGAGHWWESSDEPGAECVDWPALFDFFARHSRPGKERVRRVEFVTPNPGISASCNWLTIEQQIEPLKISSTDIQFDPGKVRFVGTTNNVARIAFDIFNVKPDVKINFEIDNQKIADIEIQKYTNKVWLKKNKNKWEVAEKICPSQKGPHRYGTFKDIIKNRLLFVYGTNGSKQENAWAVAKAKFDAECFWYQGNGSIDIVADVDFDSEMDKDRNIILYGNNITNTAWKKMLEGCLVQVNDESVKVGKKKLVGKDLSCLFIRPRPGSDIASIAVIAGTGLAGMKLCDRRQYLYPGYSLPDLIVCGSDVLHSGSKNVKVAGFFGNDWSIENGDFVWND